MASNIVNLEGTVVRGESGTKYTLTKKLAQGAQGVVYEESSGNFVVKFYFEGFAADCVMDQLRFVRNTQLPKNFVTVEDLFAKPYTGYVMRRVDDHLPLNTYLIPPANEAFHIWYNRGKGFLQRLFLGRLIATAFGELERKNLSYCDISGNNILVSATGTSVQMIDVDNIYVAGRGKPAVLGTPRYIAPEVVNGLRNPDILSDNYSLAVILYELLRVGHPYISDEVADGSPEDEARALTGECEYVTPKTSTRMLPEDVVFTDRLKELFKRCFADGKVDRLKRPPAREFEFALIEASNKVIKCPHCGAWHYPRKTGKIYEPCPWCDRESKPKARLQFYDLFFEGDDYMAAALNPKSNRTSVNSYVIKEGFKNRIPRFYVVGDKDYSAKDSLSEKSFTIFNREGKSILLNDGLDMPIRLRHYEGSNFMLIEKGKHVELRNGDQIFFEVADDKPAMIVGVGSQSYGLIRVAMYIEG